MCQDTRKFVIKFRFVFVLFYILTRRKIASLILSVPFSFLFWFFGPATNFFLKIFTEHKDYREKYFFRNQMGAIAL